MPRSPAPAVTVRATRSGPGVMPTGRPVDAVIRIDLPATARVQTVTDRPVATGHAATATGPSRTGRVRSTTGSPTANDRGARVTGRRTPIGPAAMVTGRRTPIGTAAMVTARRTPIGPAAMAIGRPTVTGPAVTAIGRRTPIGRVETVTGPMTARCGIGISPTAPSRAPLESGPRGPRPGRIDRTGHPATGLVGTASARATAVAPATAIGPALATGPATVTGQRGTTAERNVLPATNRPATNGAARCPRSRRTAGRQGITATLASTAQAASVVI